MQRRARTRLAGAALALAVTSGLAACSGVSGGDETDTKPGDATAAAEPAPPGKFRTLPEPCGAVEPETLAGMLPGAAAKAQEAAEEAAEDNTTAGTTGTPSPLDGEATLTHDTDRRVGCTWQSTTSLGSRQLTVDFERIVSYDPEVSDDEQAEELFDERAGKAGLGEPDEADATGETETGTRAMTGAGNDARNGAPNDAVGDSDDGNSGNSPKDASPSDDGTRLASPSPTPSLPPRTLEDIGDSAFIDDRLRTTADGRGSHRDITLVFRTSNVLVTVEYSQSIADAHRTPDSAELQKYAQNLARQLAEQFSES